METDKYSNFLKTRRRLYETRDKPPMDGDVPVIQLINTLHQRDTSNKDYLLHYDDFIDWALDAGIIEDPAYSTLCFESYCYAHEATEVLTRVISFRENLRDLVICLMNGIAPYPEQITGFNRFYDELNKHRSLNMNGNGMLEIWIDTHEQIAFPLWVLIKQAKDFLMGVDASLIKKCSCGNLFINRSKNQNKRWCNSSTCGSKHWSKVYYSRKKGELVD